MYYEIILKEKAPKKWREMVARCRQYCGDSVFEAYGKPSLFKVRAERQIKEEQTKLNGFDYHITGAGSCFFSCSFETKDAFYFYTPNHNYKIEK